MINGRDLRQYGREEKSANDIIVERNKNKSLRITPC